MTQQIQSAQEPAGNQKRVASVHSMSSVSEVIVPSLIFLNLAITVPLALILNIWIDEAFSLQTTGKGLSYAVRQAFYFENQPPLYYALLQIWRNMNNSPFFARLFSILCVTLTIYVVSRLSRRILHGIHPGWITAAVSLNPFVIWAAVEIRMYALVILLSSLLLLFFCDGYLSDTAKRRARWAYVCCSVAALYTQYYLGFLLIAHACVLLVLRRWRQLGSYSFDMAIVGLAFAPMVPFIFQQMSGVNSYANNPTTSLIEGTRLIYWNVIKYVLPTGDIDWLTTPRKWIAYISIVGIIFLLVRQYRSFFKPVYVTVWTTLALLLVFFLVVSTSLGEELLKIRHTSVIFLPAILAVFCLAMIVHKRGILIAMNLIMLLFYATTLYDTYRPMAKFGDWIRVSSYIMKTEKPGEPILVFRAEFILPFSFYYKGKNQVIPIPNYPNLDSYDLRSQVLHSEAELINAASPVLSHARRFRLVTRHIDPFRGVNFHPEILENFVSKYYTVVDRKGFYKSEVRLFEKKEGVQLD